METTTCNSPDFNYDLRTISPEELHLEILRAYRQGNQSRHVLMIGIVVMADTKGVLEDLSYASILEYVK